MILTNHTKGAIFMADNKPEKILTNGLTRLENVKRLQFYTQGAVERELDYCDYTFDIPYGTESPRQCIDIYTPKGVEGPFPTIIYLHGGGWFTGDRRDKGVGGSLFLVKHGFAIVSVGYRLADEAVHPGPMEDVIAGIAKATEVADQFNLNMTRLGIASGSAGSTYAMIAALRDPRFKAVYLGSSILDFTRITKQMVALGMNRTVQYGYPEQDWSMEALMLGGAVQAVPSRARELCARLHVHADMPHCLLAHGTKDNVTPFLQVVEFAEAATKATGDPNRVQLLLSPGGGHNLQPEFTKLHLADRVAFMKKHLCEVAEESVQDEVETGFHL